MSVDHGVAATPPGHQPTASATSADAPVSSQSGVPNANAQPDWFEVARALAHAIMFERATRAEHVVGRDGRVRMGMVDLLGCYAVDDAAREFFELAGLPFAEVEAPNEHQAMFMAVTGRKWHHWFTERDAIVQGAGLGPGRGRVDMDRLALASGMSASGQDAQRLRAKPASPTGEAGDATPSTPTPGDSNG